MAYYMIIGAFAGIGWLVSGRLKSKFARYSSMPTENGESGAQIAQNMLSHFGINDVKIVQGQGMLTDHYNPLSKTISLSPDVYNGRHVSAAAVAAHECGHAVQHAEAYSMLTLRSKLVPMVNISSKLQQFLFMAAMFGIASSVGGPYIMLALVITFGVTALFSLITLPVEFDASRRALLWLDKSGTTMGANYDGAKDALTWAAMTYLVQALSALTLFFYFLLKYMGSQR